MEQERDKSTKLSGTIRIVMAPEMKTLKLSSLEAESLVIHQQKPNSADKINREEGNAHNVTTNSSYRYISQLIISHAVQPGTPDTTQVANSVSSESKFYSTRCSYV